jgi:hypothetical protein
MFILCFFLMTSFAFTSTFENQSLQSIEEIIRSFISEKKDSKDVISFRIDKCQKSTIHWSQFLQNNKRANLEYKFHDGCDLKGFFSPQIFKPFLLNLEIRNLFQFTNIKTMNQISAALERNPIMRLDMKDGTLKGSESILKFEANYSIRTKSINGRLELEHLGGEILISEINAKKVHIKKKISFK